MKPMLVPERDLNGATPDKMCFNSLEILERAECQSP